MSDGQPGTVTAIAPWYGSKRTLAPAIVRQLGPHRAYWEPFCGSMAVLLAKPESGHETVNDLHGDLTNLAWVLQGPRWAELYDRCARAIITDGLFREAVRRIKGEPCGDEPDLERAYWFVLRSWWGRNGIVGAVGVGDSLAVRYTPGGGHGGVRFRAVVGSMPWWHARLRAVVILRRDAFPILESIEDVEGVALYADPPYLVKTAAYVHDFADADHGRLAESLRRFRRARVVVSYYADPRLEVLYPGWTVVRCPTAKALVSAGQRRKGRTEAPEVLLINGPAVGRDANLFSGG